MLLTADFCCTKLFGKKDGSGVVTEKYLSFMCNHYADNSCAVFDGYLADEISSTKEAKRLKKKNS